MLAIEMHMEVIIVVGIMTAAQLVAHTIATVLNDMYQMVLAEKSQGTEHTRLVDSENSILQFRERHGTRCCSQSLDHHDAVGRRLHTMVKEKFDA